MSLHWTILPNSRKVHGITIFDKCSCDLQSMPDTVFELLRSLLLEEEQEDPT